MAANIEEEPLRVTRAGPVAIIELNRPHTRNALSGEAMFAAFESVFATLNADLTIGAAVLTGRGNCFCAGGNVIEMRERSGMFAGTAEDITQRYHEGIQRIPLAFQTLDLPIIAAVNGPAIGAGCDLASMCDIRVASHAARFAESFVKLGIVPGDGGCWLLPRVVGDSHAAELTFTGDTIDAAEALRIGLVSQVVESVELMNCALALAQRIAKNPPQALRWTKQLLRRGRVEPLADALAHAGRLQGLAHHTEEHRAALEVFFTGRTVTRP